MKHRYQGRRHYNLLARVQSSFFTTSLGLNIMIKQDMTWHATRTKELKGPESPRQISSQGNKLFRTMAPLNLYVLQTSLTPRISYLKVDSTMNQLWIKHNTTQNSIPSTIMVFPFFLGGRGDISRLHEELLSLFCCQEVCSLSYTDAEPRDLHSKANISVLNFNSYMFHDHSNFSTSYTFHRQR